MQLGTRASHIQQGYACSTGVLCFCVRYWRSLLLRGKLLLQGVEVITRVSCVICSGDESCADEDVFLFIVANRLQKMMGAGGEPLISPPPPWQMEGMADAVYMYRCTTLDLREAA